MTFRRAGGANGGKQGDGAASASVPSPVPDGGKRVIRRLIADFSLRLIVAGILLVVLAVLILYWMQLKLLDLDAGRSFAQAGMLKLIDTMEVDESGTPHFDEELLDLVRSEGGWVQMLDDQGRAAYSVYTPEDVPTAYKPGEFVAYWKKKEPFPYDLAVWIRQRGGVTYTLLYGVIPEEKRLLQMVMETAGAPGPGLTLPPGLEDRLKEADAAVQLLDPSGRQVASFGSAGKVLAEYSLQELALRSVYGNRYDLKLASHYDSRTQYTWVVTIPFHEKGVLAGVLKNEIGVMLVALAGLLLTTLLLFLLLSLWYANRFGGPVLHMIDWLQQLGRGQFREPHGHRGPRSLDRKGRLQRRYRLFADVFLSLRRLTGILSRNEEMRAKLEQTREEWITGVSHDLKTPLTSIKGYSHMLEAPKYGWSADEIREFAGVIREKAEYMELLIDDLSLTYRLQNEALPLELRETELNDLTEIVIRRFRTNPRFADARIVFKPASSPLFSQIDERWLSRAIENLLANAVLHNPAGTDVEVSVAGDGEAESFVRLEIRDNGGGMDEETVGRLFERYYRGTNTEGGSDGTGLGMAIARQIVLAHHGNIRVGSELGRGTVVTIWLRQASPPVEAMQEDQV